MGKKKQKKNDWRAGFEAFLGRTAFGREYLEEVEETVKDLCANTEHSNLSKERRAVNDSQEDTQGSTKSDTSMAF